MLKHLKSREDFANKGLAAKGFTLIELLVVIIILGILAAVVIFAVGSLNKNAEKNSCKTEKKTLLTAIEAYKAQEGKYPDTLLKIKNVDLLENENLEYYTITGGGGAVKTTVGPVAGSVCV